MKKLILLIFSLFSFAVNAQVAQDVVSNIVLTQISPYNTITYLPSRQFAIDTNGTDTLYIAANQQVAMEKYDGINLTEELLPPQNILADQYANTVAFFNIVYRFYVFSANESTAYLYLDQS